MKVANFNLKAAVSGESDLGADMGTTLAAASMSADDEPFLIEGALTELHVELGKENLLAKIDKHYRVKSVATGVAEAAGDLFGQASNAAMLAMYDGEDSQNFVCLINGQVMCGQFGGAEMLKSDTTIKAVVSRKGEVLYAHAIMCPPQGLVWITHPWGSAAEAIANWKLAAWCFLFQLFGFSITLLALGWDQKSWEILQISFLGGCALCLGMAIWANSDMQALAGPSTDIFRLLGFDKPEHVNLNSYGFRTVAIREHLRDRTETEPTQDLAEYQHRNVYCYQKAIDDGKLALKK